MHRDMNHDTTSTFISAMVQAEPALMPVLDDHRAANGGLLPHVFMADVTRWLTARGPQPRLLSVLEDAVASESRYVRDLIYLSFLEQLDSGEPADRQIVASLPPKLRSALTFVGGDR